MFHLFTTIYLVLFIRRNSLTDEVNTGLGRRFKILNRLVKCESELEVAVFDLWGAADFPILGVFGCYNQQSKVGKIVRSVLYWTFLDRTREQLDKTGRPCLGSGPNHFCCEYKKVGNNLSNEEIIESDSSWRDIVAECRDGSLGRCQPRSRK